MNKLGPQSDPPRSLIVAAIGWYLLAIIPDIVAGVALGIYHLSRGETSQDIQYLLTALVQAADGGIVLSAAFLKGRALGNGDARVGLGDGPTSNRPIIALMAVLLGAFTMITDIAAPDRKYMHFIVVDNPWRRLYAIFILVILAPLAEELFFRGWLWTGLRRHWGALPTAVLTSAFFLAIHFPRSFLSLVVILPATVAFATARHLGRSVRASIAVHMLYNLNVLISPLVLRHFGLI